MGEGKVFCICLTIATIFAATQANYGMRHVIFILDTQVFIMCMEILIRVYRIAPNFRGIIFS